MAGYLSAAEAAELAGLSKEALLSHARRGHLPGERVGSFWAFDERDVQRFARTPRRGPGRPRSEAVPA